MCRQLLTDQKWLDTILPRIPLKICNYYYKIYVYNNIEIEIEIYVFY